MEILLGVKAILKTLNKVLPYYIFVGAIAFI